MSGDGSLGSVEKLSACTGQAAAWLTIAMVVVTFVIVVMRYLFGMGFIWLQESLTWMHAVVFMAGAAYTLQRDQHVRVDVFYRSMSERRRAWVDLLGTLVFVLPLCALIFYESLGYVVDSWRTGEVSRDAGGLPFPAVPLLKSMLLLMPLAVVLQGLSIATRCLGTLRRRPGAH